MLKLLSLYITIELYIYNYIYRVGALLYYLLLVVNLFLYSMNHQQCIILYLHPLLYESPYWNCCFILFYLLNHRDTYIITNLIYFWLFQLYSLILEFIIFINFVRCHINCWMGTIIIIRIWYRNHNFRPNTCNFLFHVFQHSILHSLSKLSTNDAWLFLIIYFLILYLSNNFLQDEY